MADKTYILFSSMSRCDETDFQIVAVGSKDKLEDMAKHFGVRSWMLGSDGTSTANDGRIKLVKAPVWD